MEFCADFRQLTTELLYNFSGVFLPFLRHWIILHCLKIVCPFTRLCDLTTYVHIIYELTSTISQLLWQFCQCPWTILPMSFDSLDASDNSVNAFDISTDILEELHVTYATNPQIGTASISTSQSTTIDHTLTILVPTRHMCLLGTKIYEVTAVCKQASTDT